VLPAINLFPCSVVIGYSFTFVNLLSWFDDQGNKLIADRLTEIYISLRRKMSSVESYRDLSEKEKIPFRVMQAEMTALKEALKGTNLDEALESCIANEEYCGAEGVKRAIQWLTTQPK